MAGSVCSRSIGGIMKGRNRLMVYRPHIYGRCGEATGVSS